MIIQCVNLPHVDMIYEKTSVLGGFDDTVCINRGKPGWDDAERYVFAQCTTDVVIDVHTS